MTTAAMGREWSTKGLLEKEDSQGVHFYPPPPLWIRELDNLMRMVWINDKERVLEWFMMMISLLLLLAQRVLHQRVSIHMYYYYWS